MANPQTAAADLLFFFFFPELHLKLF
uniref:Uncharacterized protein n=1 Tax=Anguilla anguilla TaxID=7936 RepID=A0A0E9UMM2_ANGAN